MARVIIIKVDPFEFLEDELRRKYGIQPKKMGTMTRSRSLSVPNKRTSLTAPYRTYRVEPYSNEDDFVEFPSWQHRSAPVLLSGLRDIVGTKGDTITLRCGIQGDPKPTITWYKDSDQLHSGMRYWMHYDGRNAELRINNLGPQDVGWYRCVAKNAFGSRQSNAGVRLSDRPRYIPPASKFRIPYQFRSHTSDPHDNSTNYYIGNVPWPSLTLAKRRRRIWRKLFYGDLLSYH